MGQKMIAALRLLVGTCLTLAAESLISPSRRLAMTGIGRLNFRGALKNKIGKIPNLHIPDVRERTRAQLNIDAVKRGVQENRLQTPSPSSRCGRRWGLLLPICSRGKAAAECWQHLRSLRDTLFDTVGEEERSQLKMLIGIDHRDAVYDSAKSHVRLQEEFAGFDKDGPLIRTFAPGYSGKLCWIWNDLARDAVKEAGVDYFVLLGDDIEILTPGWKGEIEEEFASIAADSNMPHGLACVAFRDQAFPVFPTFPVLHRRHIEVFGRLLPQEFVNQHGDPFLFEIYRRYGASRFAPIAKLRNKIGGKDAARYGKVGVVWRDEILTNALLTLSMWLERAEFEGVPTRYECFDVVVPTYRCDVATLKRITELSCSYNVSLVFIIVVDRPDAESLDEIHQLESYTQHRHVRILVQPENLGASEARNTGLAQSFGDYAVLLDDDVFPESELLDAYVGGVMRHPAAKIWVGLTRLAEPRGLMQQALAASRMCFFYGVAAQLKNPPWGVTANICVKCRGNNRVWFSDVYPKTGGGEDIDFCIRLKNMEPKAIVAVPGAVAEHPFWAKILKQTAGWARGDVLCLEMLPHLTFYTWPNWSEWLFFSFVYASFLSSGAILAWMSSSGDVLAHLAGIWIDFGYTAVLLVTIHMACRLAFNAIHYSGPTVIVPSAPRRSLVSILSLIPEMVQDITRVRSKVRRLKLNEFCMSFDWLDGQRNHPGAIHKFYFAFNLALLAATAGFPRAGPGPLVSLMPITNQSISALGFKSALLTSLVVFILPVLSDWMFKILPLFYQQCITLMSKRAGSIKSIAQGVQPFVIISCQRSGSNLLCGLLNEHPEIAMHNELFNFQNIYTYHWNVPKEWAEYHENEALASKKGGVYMALPSRDERPLDFLSEALTGSGAFKRGSGTPSRAAGFKLFPEHWHQSKQCHDAFERILADKRFKKVVLRRNNRLEACVSAMRANKTGRFLQENLDGIPVTITPEEYQLYIDSQEDIDEYYDGLLSGQDVCIITYEDIVGENGHEAMRQLFRFIGVRDDDVKVTPNEVTCKQTMRPVMEGITNFAELEYAFRHTKHAADFSSDAADV